jgi:hypothetical protein
MALHRVWALLAAALLVACSATMPTAPPTADQPDRNELEVIQVDPDRLAVRDTSGVLHPLALPGEDASIQLDASPGLLWPSFLDDGPLAPFGPYEPAPGPRLALR